MKQIGSEIIAKQTAKHTKTGTQGGELGSAMPASFRAADLPAATPELTKQLSRQGLEEHRGRIASDVKIVLSAYFQPSETDETRLGQISWWCDELEDWEHKQVVYALRKWNRDEPRKRPTPGDILAVLKQMRGQAEAKRRNAQPAPPEAAKDRGTAEERQAAAEAILAQTGFAPKRMPKGGK